MLYDQPSSDSYIATVEDTTPLYELGRVDGFIRVYAKEIADGDPNVTEKIEHMINVRIHTKINRSNI